MNDDLTARVIRILAAVKRVPPESIRPEATLEELGIDSLDKVNILFELEGEFDVAIPDEEARKITTVSEIVARLQDVIGQTKRSEA
jgi:acyl carrier protein